MLSKGWLRGCTKVKEARVGSKNRSLSSTNLKAVVCDSGASDFGPVLRRPHQSHEAGSHRIWSDLGKCSHHKSFLVTLRLDAHAVIAICSRWLLPTLNEKSYLMYVQSDPLSPDRNGEFGVSLQWDNYLLQVAAIDK